MSGDPDLGGLPEELRGTVEKALAKNPDRRMTAGSAAEECARLLTAQTTHALSAGAGPGATRPDHPEAGAGHVPGAEDTGPAPLDRVHPRARAHGRLRRGSLRHRRRAASSPSTPRTAQVRAPLREAQSVPRRSTGSLPQPIPPPPRSMHEPSRLPRIRRHECPTPPTPAQVTSPAVDPRPDDVPAGHEGHGLHEAHGHVQPARAERDPDRRTGPPASRPPPGSVRRAGGVGAGGVSRRPGACPVDGVGTARAAASVWRPRPRPSRRPAPAGRAAGSPPAA